MQLNSSRASFAAFPLFKLKPPLHLIAFDTLPSNAMNNNHNLSRAPSYAGSNSSSDSSAPGSFHSHDSSALSSIHSHDSSAPSSIHSHFADEEEWSRIQQRSADLVGSLLKEQRESGTMLRAWSVRCSTLEDEVERLARRVMQLEAEAAQRTIKVDVAAPVVALSSPPGLSPKAGSVWRRTTTTIEPPTAPSISTPSAAIPQIDPTKSMRYGTGGTSQCFARTLMASSALLASKTLLHATAST